MSWTSWIISSMVVMLSSRVVGCSFGAVLMKGQVIMSVSSISSTPNEGSSYYGCWCTGKVLSTWLLL